MTVISIRDEKGTVYNEVKRPAIVFDKESGTLYKLGEYDDMKTHYKEVVDAYNFYNISRNLVLLELPKDQEIVDKVFQNTGYIKLHYENVMKTLQK